MKISISCRIFNEYLFFLIHVEYREPNELAKLDLTKNVLQCKIIHKREGMPSWPSPPDVSSIKALKYFNLLLYIFSFLFMQNHLFYIQTAVITSIIFLDNTRET